MRCDCVNIKHPSGRCESEAKHICHTCGFRLCGHCKQQHHAVGHDVRPQPKKALRGVG